VIFELLNSHNNVKASGYMTSDLDGAYSKSITTTSGLADGSYSVFVSTTVGDQTASNSVTFQVVPEFPVGTNVTALVSLLVVFGVLGKLRRARSGGLYPRY